MTEQHQRILLIDDTASIHDDFRKILLPRPASDELAALEAAVDGRPKPTAEPAFELDSALQGRDGVTLAQAAVQAGRPYSLAFVDMRMPPGWNGVETIERLWQVDPQLQIVICTAHSDHPWEQVMARLQVRDRLLVLKKPFDVIEVTQLARTLTAKWQATRESVSRIESLADALERLRYGEAALRRAHGELQVFTHSLAHDLRAPLTALGSFSQLLAAELQGRIDGKALHYINRVQANAGIGAHMIDQLLLLDRISQVHLRPEPLELGALARELADELRSTDPARNMALEVPEPLPAAADRALLLLALRQLLENAWKFSTGQPRTRIEIGRHSGAAGETDCFFVRDNGAGFEIGDARQLFRTFRRLHNDSAIPGIGAGLVIVNRVIERHGGRLWAEAQPGAGATFYFTLGPGAADATPAPPSTPGDAGGARTTPTPT